MQFVCRSQCGTGTWVLVKFYTENQKKGAQYFHGTLLQDDLNARETQIKFLWKRGKFYSFPDIEDIAWVPTAHLTVLKPPTINARDHHFLAN